MTTENDETDANIYEESSLQFHNKIQQEDSSIKAQLLKSINQMKAIQDNQMKEQFETALMFHHKLFFVIEDYKMAIHEKLLVNSKKDESDSDDHMLEEVTQGKQCVDVNIEENTESDK